MEKYEELQTVFDKSTKVKETELGRDGDGEPFLKVTLKRERFMFEPLIEKYDFRVADIQPVRGKTFCSVILKLN